MKKKLFLPFIFLFSIFSFPLSSQEVKFSGEAGTVWAAALRSEKQGDFVLGDTYLNAKLDAFYENSSAYVEGRLGFDEVSDKTYCNLREIWLDYTSDFWGIRIGRQKTAWGKADGIDITNVICPRDYSTARALFNDEHKAINAARFSLNKGNFSLDTYFIPFFTSPPLPEEKIMKLSSIIMPEKNLKSAEYGLKLSGYLPKCDLSLYGFYGFEDTPFLNYSPKIENDAQTGIDVTAEYKKMEMLGADAAIPLGETVLRLEAAFFPNRHFQKSTDTIIKEKMLSLANGSSSEIENTLQRNEISVLVGLDWMPEGWTFTAQYYGDYLFGSTENLDRTKNYTHGATLNVSKKLLQETLKLSASGIVHLNDLDSVIKFSAEYALSDSIYLEAGGYIFNEGKETGTYGEYKNLTSAYLKARYVF